MGSIVFSPPSDGFACKVCDCGTLQSKKVFRMSGPVVAIGFILLIPSVLGMAVCGLASLGLLSVGVAQSSRDVAAGAVWLSTVSAFGFVAFFVGGLLGWLLVMRKRVLQCSVCGAVVNAS